MAEIFDFIIGLLAIFKGTNQSYKREFSRAIEMHPEEQKITYDSFKEHIEKDPATRDVIYSYLYVIMHKKNMKIIALDEQFMKVLSVNCVPRFQADWKYGKTSWLGEVSK